MGTQVTIFMYYLIIYLLTYLFTLSSLSRGDILRFINHLQEVRFSTSN